MLLLLPLDLVEAAIVDYALLELSNAATIVQSVRTSMARSFVCRPVIRADKSSRVSRLNQCEAKSLRRF